MSHYERMISIQLDSPSFRYSQGSEWIIQYLTDFLYFQKDFVVARQKLEHILKNSYKNFNIL
jgi:hypothetical protein